MLLDQSHSGKTLAIQKAFQIPIKADSGKVHKSVRERYSQMVLLLEGDYKSSESTVVDLIDELLTFDELNATIYEVVPNLTGFLNGDQDMKFDYDILAMRIISTLLPQLDYQPMIAGHMEKKVERLRMIYEKRTRTTDADDTSYIDDYYRSNRTYGPKGRHTRPDDCYALACLSILFGDTRIDKIFTDEDGEVIPYEDFRGLVITKIENLISNPKDFEDHMRAFLSGDILVRIEKRIGYLLNDTKLADVFPDIRKN
jgi:hypothetical protein